ncbi:semaphorin 4G S homeolog [Xenopus laevis]|uniref:MGC84614 protein n=1 Tax=Xenopus laevis TaxID=8355 RepID=Q6NRA4_XENLA|nr:semaphorin 4G S homeolog [Xenopus laevis]AAH70859.1 MGC84614 protein [Xenopus laevis]
MVKQMTRCLVVLCTISAIGYYSSEGSSVGLDATPRITVAYNEISDLRRFSSRVSNYSTLLLEDERGILYVGARGAIFSLNSSNISQRYQKAIPWEVTAQKHEECMKKGKNNQTECFNHIRLLLRFNETHLYACGTYAFSPLCTYIDSRTFVLSSETEEGKEKCPYDPAKGYISILVDGGLYTASRYEFRNLPDIRRNLFQRSLKTEESNLHWLNDAEFVSAALVPESMNVEVGDDDKIYYFFNEKVVEESSSFLGSKTASIARVCKSDLGGKKILQRKWTSFLKARLVCYMPFYEVLQSAYTLELGTWDTTIFYGAFVSQWKNMEASAICRYSISDIQKVFEGPYMEYQYSSRKWSRYEGEVPSPRPGSCITNEFRSNGFNTSQDLPNNVLDFVRLHPLMCEKVRPIEEQPLLMKRNIIYTRIAVDRVKALDNVYYDVLFLGTDDGWLHKAVVIGSAVHIIEEMQVYKFPQPIEKLVISKKQNTLYIGAQSGVLQIPLFGCSQYISCYDCILARNPYCAWDGHVCRDIIGAKNRTQMTQDMQNGNGGCLNSTDDGPLKKKVRTVIKGNDVLLQCDLRSNLARPQWYVNGTNKLYNSEGHTRLGVDGLLITDTLPEHSGEYNCYSEENGLQSLIAAYSLNVLLELPKEKNLSTPTPIIQLPTAASQSSSNIQFIYISTITILGVLCIVLSVVLLYVSCQQKKKGKYAVRNSRSLNVELQTVSSQFKEKAEESNSYSDGCLQIIPGEASTMSPHKDMPPPPPPPPPLPSEFTNGISTLPNMLRKMNGNSYMLLRQNEESSLPSYNSFTEELSKILEKRKHTQLVEKLDESSV